ncbi:hypothetical protein D3C86_2199710 [compost metagenome]
MSITLPPAVVTFPVTVVVSLPLIGLPFTVPPCSWTLTAFRSTLPPTGRSPMSVQVVVFSFVALVDL